MALLFDGDAGGRAAARHLASRLRHAPLPSTIAFCPEGQDPDDVVRADGPRSLAALALAGRDPVDLILDGIPISDRDSIEARVSTLRTLLIAIQRRSRPLTDPQLERIAQMFGIRLPTIRSAIADIGDRGDFTPTVSGLTLARSST